MTIHAFVHLELIGSKSLLAKAGLCTSPSQTSPCHISISPLHHPRDRVFYLEGGAQHFELVASDIQELLAKRGRANQGR